MSLRILINLVIIIFIFLCPVNNAFSSHREDKGYSGWNPISAGPLTTWTAPLCGKGKFVLQPFFFYNRTRGSFNAEGDYNSLPKADKKYQHQQQLFIQYGLTGNLEIDGQMVYQENFVKQGGLKAHSDGLGDNYFFLRYCALEEENRLPHLTGIFQIKIPTGKYEHADPNKLGTDSMGATSGGGSYDLGLGANLSKKIKPFIFHADAVYNFPQAVKVDGIKTEYARYLNYDAGMEYFLTKGLNLMLEFNGFLQGDKRQDGLKAPALDIRYLNIASGIGWSNNKIQTLLAYQRTLTGTNTDANDSVVFTFVYTF